MIEDHCIACWDRGVFECDCGVMDRPPARIVPPVGGANPPGYQEAGRRAALLDRFWHGLDTLVLPSPVELDPGRQVSAGHSRRSDDDAA
jgi:hypothetical protein